MEAQVLQAMAEKWKRSARRRFLSAESYAKGSMERRSLEMSAMCIANCAFELSAAIQDDSCPQPATTPPAA